MAEQVKGKWSSFSIEIITPERVVVDEQMEGVVIPSTEGLLGILRTFHWHLGYRGDQVSAEW